MSTSVIQMVREGVDFDSQFVEICVKAAGALTIGNSFDVDLILVTQTATLGVDYQFGVIPPEGCLLPPSNNYLPFLPIPGYVSSTLPTRNLRIHFAPGESLPATSCGIVTILIDEVFEGPESLQLSINSTCPFEVPTVQLVSSSLVITDTEGTCKLLVL